MIRLRQATLVLTIVVCLLIGLHRTNYRLSAEASPITIIVDDDGPADFNNIQGAINSASTSDTILVRTGTYYENVVINKSISLIGEDRDHTIIDGSGLSNVVNVTISGAYVENFTVQRSGTSIEDSGIVIARSTGNVISNNRIVSNSRGISLYSSYSNMIFGNNITANIEGTYFVSSSNNTFSDNIVDSNSYDGISLYSSSNNTFSGNTISNNGLNGISFYYSGINVIRGNNISANSVYGLAYLYSSGNTIYHNNFNNTIQVFGGSTQSWNYNGEGNYWKDYAGRDQNSDGIGDDPYPIIANGDEDRYPLMGAFSDFGVALEKKTYHVTIVSNSTVSEFGFQIGTETGNRIISFRAATENGKIGFSRVTFPRELMEDPYVILVGSMKATPTLLSVADPANVCLYFTYSDGDATISIIASETLHLYSELLAEYLELQGSLQTLNQTYYGLLTNFVKLQTDLFSLSKALNDSSVQYLELQGSLQTLNLTYHSLLANYGGLLGNYTSLLQDFDAMMISYQQHLYSDSEQTQNIRSLIYIFAATAAIFIVTIIYLSRLQSAGVRRRTNGHVSSETSAQFGAT